MRVLFFGTPIFAAKVLDFLLESHVHVVGVISKPDRPKGRSLHLIPVPVKEVAAKYDIPVFQPEKVSDISFLDTLKEFHADLFVVVAYGEILKPHVLDLPQKGCINLHASLLPLYRGAAPIHRAIINGEKKSGVTIMHMVKKMDAGDILSQVEVKIPLEMTYDELQEKLLEVGKEALLEVIMRSESGKLTGVSQEEEKATFAPKIELEDCAIDFDLPLMQIHNLIRGASSLPGAFCNVDIGGEIKRLKIFRSHPYPLLESPLRTLSLDLKKRVLVGLNEGSLELLEVQLDGKKRMRGHDFFIGCKQDKVLFL